MQRGSGFRSSISLLDNLIHHLFLLTATIHGSRHKRSEVLTYPPPSQRELLLHYTRSSGRPTRGQSRKTCTFTGFFFFGNTLEMLFFFSQHSLKEAFSIYSKLVLKLIIFYLIKPDCCCHSFCKSLMKNIRVQILHIGLFLCIYLLSVTHIWSYFDFTHQKGHSTKHSS